MKSKSVTIVVGIILAVLVWYKGRFDDLAINLAASALIALISGIVIHKQNSDTVQKSTVALTNDITEEKSIDWFNEKWIKDNLKNEFIKEKKNAGLEKRGSYLVYTDNKGKICFGVYWTTHFEKIEFDKKVDETKKEKAKLCPLVLELVFSKNKENKCVYAGLRLRQNDGFLNSSNFIYNHYKNVMAVLRGKSKDPFDLKLKSDNEYFFNPKDESNSIRANIRESELNNHEKNIYSTWYYNILKEGQPLPLKFSEKDVENFRKENLPVVLIQYFKEAIKLFPFSEKNGNW